MREQSPKLYIFDADGTLRWTTIPGQPCPNGPGEWRLMPEVREVLGRIDWGQDGAMLGIASNQGGVALGYMTWEMAYRLMEETIREAIGFVPARTKIEMCVCPPADDCDCRKPNPGMLLNIMRHFGISRAETLYVGDLEKDRAAAERAGVRFMWAHEFFAKR